MSTKQESTRERIEETTSGKKASSFRVGVPSRIVNAMGLRHEERSLVYYDPSEPDTIILKKLTKDDLLRLFRGE